LLSRDADSEIWLIGLGAGKQRLGGSILAQVHPTSGAGSAALAGLRRSRCRTSTIRSACARSSRSSATHATRGLLCAYHDRSDGGAFAALCEMAFASHLGLDISLDGWGEDPFRTLFNEELGALVQIAAEDRAEFADLVARHGLIDCAQRIARPTTASNVRVMRDGTVVTEWRWEALFDAWWSVTHGHAAPARQPRSRRRRARLRAPLRCAGPAPKLTFDPTRMSPRRTSAPAHVRAWRSCASRASTARSRRPTASTAPGSRRSTCT
jgi:phosphoribosylformylglycinamidine synthase